MVILLERFDVFLRGGGLEALVDQLCKLAHGYGIFRPMHVKPIS
jgi:hypothetical protein